MATMLIAAGIAQSVRALPLNQRPDLLQSICSLSTTIAQNFFGLTKSGSAVRLRSAPASACRSRRVMRRLHMLRCFASYTLASVPLQDAVLEH